MPADAIHRQHSQREQDALAQVGNSKNVEELLYHKKLSVTSVKPRASSKQMDLAHRSALRQNLKLAASLGDLFLG